jgi:DNA-binding NarL/FixJ family response regulator
MTQGINIHMKKAKLLIVDKHTEVLRWVEKRVAQNENFEICKASTLDEVKDSLQECNPDILLIDPYMPAGLDLSSLQGFKEENPHVIIVIFAAVIDDNDRRKFSDLEINFVLEKRVACEKLIRTLTLALEITNAKKKKI